MDRKLDARTADEDGGCRGIAVSMGTRSVRLDEVDVNFVTREDGIIDARVDEKQVLLNHALEDSISSRAPRGSTPGLSTYWIDRAERGLRSAMKSGSADWFLSGNVTYLRLDGDRVVVGYDFEPDEQHAESIGVADFLWILERWRQVVIEAGGASGAEAEPPISPRPMGPPTTPPLPPFPPDT